MKDLQYTYQHKCNECARGFEAYGKHEFQCPRCHAKFLQNVLTYIERNEPSGVAIVARGLAGARK